MKCNQIREFVLNKNRLNLRFCNHCFLKCSGGYVSYHEISLFIAQTSFFTTLAIFRVYIIIYRKTQKAKQKNYLIEIKNSIKNGDNM